MNIKKLKEAASNFGTPVYVYDLSIIENQYKKLQNAFKNLDNYKIHFASKSLSNISILKFIRNLGMGLDAVSIEEIKIGIKCGFNKDEILYTPNGVEFSEIIEAKSLGVKINLDSFESIKDFSEQYPNHPISIRINPGVYAGGNENISVGHSDSKFGIPEEFIKDLIKMDEKGKIKVTGLHIHTGSDIIKNNQFDEGIKKIFSIATKFQRIESIDLGGGIKIPYFSGDTETNLKDYAKVIDLEYKKFKNITGRELKLIFEPGKYLVSESGHFITKVNYIKKSKNNYFAQVNSGFNHFIRPTLYKSYHEIINLSNPNDPKVEYTVVGYICEKDTFAEKRMISKISKDDILCFKNAGAYGYNMSSNYNSRLRPAELCIHDGKIKKIREEENLEDLLNNQIDIF
ncbi:MAG: diaminopimelate decarboxylase [Flavobacteriaceae bacterium]|nr:diaminopimelate decarboxylase [Flavobacteriaceae bacterium]